MPMKNVVFTVLLISIISQSGLAQPALMPLPKQVEYSEARFRLDENFWIKIDGPQNSDLQAYVDRFWERLGNRTGTYYPHLDRFSTGERGGLRLTYQNISSINLDMNEEYSLQVETSGVTLSAQSQVGIMRGLETLLQLLEVDREGYYFYGCSISDGPRFPWRGLLLDVCRHWMPMPVVKRTLDAMAAVKLNVIHLHLTEDQGFRVESKVYPKLHELGSDGKYFTQEEIRQIIGYANARGIRVVPEFDMPGHATSWFVGYPELASAPGPYEIERKFGVHDPTMDPTRESTYKFLDKFLTEMAALFNDQFIHIGGDENNGRQWDANPQIQQFMNENGLESNHQLQAYFNERINKILTINGKRMVGWDEIQDPDLPKTIVIQSWRGKESLMESAEAGYDGLLSNGFYIDLVQSAEFHYMNEPLPKNTRIQGNVMRHFLGGEATMWSEIVSPETVDSRIWPRTAAIAERLWSPGSVRDVASMYQRLEKISVQLEEHGLNHISGPHMMIRRIVGPKNEQLLVNLMDYVEPIEGYRRRKPSSKMPLSRAPDIAAPDALPARKFNLLVKNYLDKPDPAIEDEIKSYLLGWIENDKNLKTLGRQNYAVREFLPLSSELARSSIIAMQALSENVNHDSDWRTKAIRTLDNAAEPVAECEIKVLEGIRNLVDSAN